MQLDYLPQEFEIRPERPDLGGEGAGWGGIGRMAGGEGRGREDGADIQRETEAAVPALGSVSYSMSCPNLLSLLKEIGLGFLLTATKLTCTEIFPVAFMHKSRFLAIVTKLFKIQCLFISPSQLNMFPSCFIFQSYLAIFFSTSFFFRTRACCVYNTPFSSSLSGQSLFGLQISV